MNLVVYFLTKKRVSYESNDGRKLSIKPTSKVFKIANSTNPVSRWVGKASLSEFNALNNRIDIEAFMSAAPKFSIKQAIVGGKVYGVLDYLFGEDFRTINQEMIDVFDKIRVDINKEDDAELSELKELLIKHIGCKIFSIVEEDFSL
jgi:hypothetical protein